MTIARQIDMTSFFCRDALVPSIFVGDVAEIVGELLEVRGNDFSGGWKDYLPCGGFKKNTVGVQ